MDLLFSFARSKSLVHMLIKLFLFLVLVLVECYALCSFAWEKEVYANMSVSPEVGGTWCPENRSLLRSSIKQFSMTSIGLCMLYLTWWMLLSFIATVRATFLLRFYPGYFSEEGRLPSSGSEEDDSCTWAPEAWGQREQHCTLVKIWFCVYRLVLIII